MCIRDSPYGADGSLYVLKSLGEAAYGGAIVEMQPLWVQLGPLFAVPVATMALGPVSYTHLFAIRPLPAIQSSPKRIAAA